MFSDNDIDSDSDFIDQIFDDSDRTEETYSDDDDDEYETDDSDDEDFDISKLSQQMSSLTRKLGGSSIGSISDLSPDLINKIAERSEKIEQPVNKILPPAFEKYLLSQQTPVQQTQIRTPVQQTQIRTPVQQNILINREQIPVRTPVGLNIIDDVPPVQPINFQFLQNKPVTKILTNEDIQNIIAKSQNISINNVTPLPVSITPDINDLIQKESSESSENFDARKKLTFKIASIPNFKLNNNTSVILGHMIMKKSTLGVSYDSDIESVIKYILSLLK